MYNFTIKRSFFLVPHEHMIGEFNKIDNFMALLEKSGVGKIIKNVKRTDLNHKGRKGYNPYNLFAAIIYCFSKFKGTLRDIEDKVMYDYRVSYILEGNIPDHSTIGNFINKYILPYHYEIFTLINIQIIKELDLDISDIFGDGTKLEANANKYKFVWKPTKFHQKLDRKIKEYLVELESISLANKKGLVTAYEINVTIKDFALKNNIDIYNIPNGKGKRLSKEQKLCKTGYKYLEKLIEYEEKERICGENRNSYFKTDIDATAMMLKEDYYSKLSHDFHAAYNFQAYISSGLIMMYGIFQDRTDYHTLIPMLNLYKKYYGFYPKNICDDAGYGIYENYLFLKKNNIGNYIKFQNWKGESSGKNPQLFYSFDDGVMCLNTNIGEEIKFSNNHQKEKKTKLYKFSGCNSCGFSYKCRKKLKKENQEKDYRIVELNIEYELLKEEARKNLLSPKGIEMRINRSIQSEGTFGQLKNNMDYNRIRRRGIEKVKCEIMLECLGANIRRYFKSQDSNKFQKSYWKCSPNLQSEKFPSVKQKKKL